MKQPCVPGEVGTPTILPLCDPGPGPARPCATADETRSSSLPRNGEVAAPGPPEGAHRQAAERAESLLPRRVAPEAARYTPADSTCAADSTGADGGASATPRGSSKWNADPLPGRLSTQIRPPCASTAILQNVSPSPDDASAPAPPRLSHLAKIVSWCSGAIPTP